MYFGTPLKVLQMVFTIKINETGQKICRPVTSRQEFLKLRSSSEQVRNLKLARSGDKEAKKRLVQMNYSCIPNEDGTLKGSKTPSNSVGMDVDFNPQLPDYEQKMKDAPKTILAHKDELGLLMLERSVNKGVHLVFRRHRELSQEENLRWASDLLGIEYDHGAKDLTRVFFSTGATEDDLLYLSDDLFDATPMQPSIKAETEQPSKKTETEPKQEPAHTEKSLPTAYRSTPYSSIIEQWFTITGGEPAQGERHTRLTQLASQLRAICDNNSELLLNIIPHYGLPDGEVKEIVQWACKEPIYSISGTLKEAIELAEAEQKAASTPYPTFTPSKLPPALRASLVGVPKDMYWPVIASLLPAAAAYADGVEVKYTESEIHHLGLMSIIVGIMAGGKSKCADVVKLWMQQMEADDKAPREREDEWKTKLKTRKQNEALPNPPKEFIKKVSADITCTELLRKLKNADGHTLYSFSEELDTLTKSNKGGSWTEKYAIYRLAFDRGEWSQDRASTESVSGIAEVAYNWTMLGTYGVLGPIRENTENGLASRLIMAEMPDNSFAPMPHNKPKTDNDKMLIQEGVRRLCSRKGFVDTPRLRRNIHKWVEDKRLEAKIDNDHVKDIFRRRSAVIGFRAGVVCHLLWGDEKESKKTVDFALKVAELTLRGQIRIFSKEMLKLIKRDLAFISATSGKKSNDTLAKLPTEFTKDDLLRLKGASCSDGTLRSNISRWTKNGLIEKIGTGKWRKVA